MTSEPAAATAGSFEFEPHNCFACGSLNEHGLKLDLHLGSARSWAEFVLDPRFEGWVGIAHGGIIATILDEVMAWALVAEENWGVTARMTVEYRRPIPIGTPIRAEGWVVRSRRRIVDAAGHITNPAGNILAESQAVYVAADAERQRELRARYGYRVRAARDSGLGTPDGVDATTMAAQTARRPAPEEAPAR